jgi:hypothetical protein
MSDDRISVRQEMCDVTSDFEPKRHFDSFRSACEIVAGQLMAQMAVRLWTGSESFTCIFVRPESDLKRTREKESEREREREREECESGSSGGFVRIKTNFRYV